MRVRVEAIQELLEKDAALLITSGANRFYFTGFRSSAGKVLITKTASYFLIDFRYFEKAKKAVQSCEVLLGTRQVSEVRELLEKHAVKKLFVETETMSVAQLQQYTTDYPGIEISRDAKFDNKIKEMRSQKTKEELSLICAAQKMTDETFSYILERIEAGRTEIDVMLDMEFYMRRLGSEGVSFDFIVVSGANSSLPHGVPGDKKIEIGDFVTMDFGAVVGGYRSDMTRTVAVGCVNDSQRKVYDTVLKAQLESLAAIRAGVKCADIDKVARDIIYGAGYEGCFGHGLGHSVGIEIHEDPSFNTVCNTELLQGTVMTVEPGIYLEGKFGVRIEDMVYVTDDGCINLTASEKNLIIL